MVVTSLMHNEFWGLKAGQAVTHDGRKAVVVAVKSGVDPQGPPTVPIMYQGEAGCFVLVPLSEITRGW